MLIAGLQKLSLVDYPGKLAATIFLGGCNFRCPFCHNPQLLENRAGEIFLEEGQVLSFLEKRKGYLQGVVITGGEPLLNSEIIEWLKKIKDIGYEIKLDTNGSNFQILKEILEMRLANYVAMDVKAPLLAERYREVARIDESIFERVWESVKYLMDDEKRGPADYEFRTTVVPDVLGLDEIEIIAGQIKGARRYFLQQFNNSHEMLDERMREVQPYSREDLEKVLEKVKDYFEICGVRNV